MRRRGGPGDPAAAAASLPPLVRGPARCWLRCSVPRVLWAGPQPAAVVRLRWWGESSGGTVLQPAGRAGQPAGRTCARFAVRCGPRQLAAYLADMGVLVLEVLTKREHLPLGRAQITKLSQLSPSHPIKGSFAVVSPTSEKLGELQVSLVLEPLPELYGTSTCVPATQGGSGVAAAQGSSKCQPPAPSQQPGHAQGTVQQEESVDNSKATSPRGKDHLLYQENSENMKDTFPAPHSHGILPDEDVKMSPEGQPLSFPTSADPKALPRGSTRVLSVHNPATKDLLSALLDQGSKLRDAMVVSAMKSSPDMEIELNKMSHFIERDNFEAPAKNPKGLKSSLVPTPGDAHHLGSEVSDQQFDLNSEERAIQLLLGSADFSPGQLWDRTGSLWDSLSLGSEVYDSELGDPHYDQSLLERLFYTAPKSDSSLSDFLSDDDVKASKKASKADTVKKAAPVSPQKDFHAFDPNVTETKPSCSPTAPPEDHREMSLLTSLGADRLALLQQVHLARVTIESLRIPPESIQTSPRRKGLLGKPPRPMSVHKCTFFVEYHFPVRVSKDGKGQVSIATEAIRVASSKITDDVVKFQQQSVFPVWLGERMMEHWWGSDLAFKIYMRKSTQKKAVAIGSAALQLRRVIEAEQLSVSWDVPVEKDGEHTQVGPLKVSLQLVAGAAARSATAGHPAPAPQLRGAQLGLQEPRRRGGSAGIPPCSTRSPEECRGPGAGGRDIAQPLCPVPARDEVAHIPPAEEQGLLLHVLLMVPDGKDFMAEGSGLPSSCNVYLNCKLLSTEEAMRSAVVWGTRQPAFNFSQVMPFSLTSKRLERLKNNVMIIEAWNKLGSPGSDKLLGLVKLPLHQFYISFKDPWVSHLLLQAQYPVVAVDGLVPVVDVFTGSTRGSLRVTLAMGSAEQIVALQRLKSEEGMVPPVAQRPPHSLDHLATQPTLLDPGEEDLMEHVFEIHVESVKGLTPLQSTVWGEADCYIQYYFPVQEAGCGALQGPGLHEDGITLKPFRTATTLCVPDPIFNDEHHHSLLVPADVPVQRLLVSAFMSPGAAGGGIQFEVWCRYYYPNVRDQLVAKGALPLSRLCAMVTLQHREEIGIQTFNLPLVPRSDSSEEFHLRSSGLLDVSVRYQRSLKTAERETAQAVSLSVQIHRAAGLQAAARAVARRSPSVRCHAGAGVNAYVCALPSFLPPARARRTRAVPCSFCPEFGQRLRFLCQLITRNSTGEASSLGELLQSGSVFFSIYHQSTKSATGKLADRTSRDYLLGTVTIPTRDLLSRRSGVSGWFPVTLSEAPLSPQCSSALQAVVGGLELSVAFAQQGDRERVLEAARLLGWSSEEPHGDGSEDWEQSAGPVAVTVSTPRLWLPLHCVLLAGQAHLHESTRCYLRYRLYDQEPTCTWLRRPELSDDMESVTVSFRKPSKVTLRRSQGLLWFFREEKLEIQVWWAYGKDNEAERPLDTDRLIGSAYVDLAALAEGSRRMLSVSGVYPLFRCNAADLAGAAVRVHVSVAPSAPALPRAPCAEQGSSSSSSESGGTGDSPTRGQQLSDKQQVDVEGSGITGGQPQEEDMVFLENTVAVNILVERAMHLSLKGSPLTEREVAAPSSCVSFAVAGAEAPVTTPVVGNTDSPVWDFQQQARLSKELLLDPQQTLVFKVWHKAESERVIGFAAVDLSPLLSGFQLVCGWYNITDFSGQCRGQIKVAVSPLQSISSLREERQARARGQPESSAVKVSFPACPSNSAHLSKQMLNSLSKEISVPAREHRMGPAGTQPPRHEEHMQNVRRFHESLQRAEGSPRRFQGSLQQEDRNGNACHTTRRDTAPLASRAALLTALRKNLSELDEVQRYFSEKLTRSFPDFSTSRPGHEERESDRQGSMGREGDPKGCHLLEKSSQLVSQVSSLINDLQTITKNSKAASGEHQESSRKRGAWAVPGWQQGGGSPAAPEGQLEVPAVPSVPRDTQQPCPAGRAVFGRHMLHQLLGPIVPEDEHPFGQENEGAFATQPHSEEEYEEDVIEPRTLNEITTMTDRTSPWSSIISETGQGAELQPLEPRPEGQHSIDVGCFQRGNSSTLSSMLQGDSQGLLSALSPPVSPSVGGNSRWGAAGDLQGFHSHTGAAAGDLQRGNSSTGTAAGDLQGFHSSTGAAAGDLQGFHSHTGTAAGDFQTIKESVELHAGSKELLPSPADIGLSNEKGTERVEEEDAEAVNGDHQGKAGSGSDENCAQSVSAQAGSERNSESFPDDSSEDAVEGSENPIKQKVTLSDPVVVPNFFLPPQEMEASMRLLCTSSHPSSPPKGRSGAVPAGIPYRRVARPRPSPQLSQEEAKRIARIFSAQLSTKE